MAPISYLFAPSGHVPSRRPSSWWVIAIFLAGLASSVVSQAASGPHTANSGDSKLPVPLKKVHLFKPSSRLRASEIQQWDLWAFRTGHVLITSTRNYWGDILTVWWCAWDQMFCIDIYWGWPLLQLAQVCYTLPHLFVTSPWLKLAEIQGGTSAYPELLNMATAPFSMCQKPPPIASYRHSATE